MKLSHKVLRQKIKEQFRTLMDKIYDYDEQTAIKISRLGRNVLGLLDVEEKELREKFDDGIKIAKNNNLVDDILETGTMVIINFEGETCVYIDLKEILGE